MEISGIHGWAILEIFFRNLLEIIKWWIKIFCFSS